MYLINTFSIFLEPNFVLLDLESKIYFAYLDFHSQNCAVMKMELEQLFDGAGL